MYVSHVLLRSCNNTEFRDITLGTSIVVTIAEFHIVAELVFGLDRILPASGVVQYHDVSSYRHENCHLIAVANVKFTLE